MRLGVDIGGTKTEAVVLDGTDRIVAQLKIPTEWGPAGVVATAVRAIGSLGAETNLTARDFSSIGIGVPGMVPPGTARVTHAVNLGVLDLDLGGELRARLGVDIRVENDVKAAALGVHRLLGRDGSMAFLNLGTGVAAGIVLDGKLWSGARSSAGEIGHISVDPAGAMCTCGQRGCIETFVGGAAISALWGGSDLHPARAVFDAAALGDAKAITIRNGLASGAAAAVRILALTVDVEKIVIGGGTARLGETLLEAVRDILRLDAAGSPFIASLELDSKIETEPLWAPAAAVGAALIGESQAK